MKLVIKPFYNKKQINKDEYKDIMRRAVPKVSVNYSAKIFPSILREDCAIRCDNCALRFQSCLTQDSSISTKFPFNKCSWFRLRKIFVVYAKCLGIGFLGSGFQYPAKNLSSIEVSEK